VRREAGRAFADMVGNLHIKLQLLLGDEKTVNEALELQTVLLGARPRKMSARTFWGSWSPPPPPTYLRDNQQPGYWRCGRPRHFRGSRPYETEEDDRRLKRGHGRPECGNDPCVWNCSIHRKTTLPRTGSTGRNDPSAGSVRVSVLCGLTQTKMLPETPVRRKRSTETGKRLEEADTEKTVSSVLPSRYDNGCYESFTPRDG
jgi:hypothetical protein